MGAQMKAENVIFRRPLSVAMLVIMLAVGSLLSPATADYAINVYHGNTADGGNVTEHVRGTTGSDYEVLNITVKFKNGSHIYATRPSDQNDTILLCAAGFEIGLCFGLNDNSYITNCVSIASQSGLATNFSCNSHRDYPGGKPPGVIPGIDTTKYTTDGVSFFSFSQELAPWYSPVQEDRYRFNSTSLVRNASNAIALNATQLELQNQIKDAFTTSWSAVSFLSFGVLAHGPRALYVTDGNGGGANLTDSAGVPLDTTSAPSKGSTAAIGACDSTVSLLLLILIALASLHA